MWVDPYGWYWRREGTRWQYLDDELVWQYGHPRGPLRRTDDPPPTPVPADVGPIIETARYQVLRGPKGDKGDPGEQGPPGDTGPIGPAGPSFDGTAWWYGDGPPGTIVGSKVGDAYMDLETGLIYELQ